MLRFLDALTLQRVLIAAAGWLLGFALLYAVVPCFAPDLGSLKDVKACSVPSIGLAAYASVITMFSLGYSDVYPQGALRAFAALQVVGGVVITGLAIATIVALPTSHVRRAILA